MASKKEKIKTAPIRLIHKYILEIRDEDTFEKKLSFRLSRLNVLTVIGLFSGFLIIGVIFLIAFTPLREYIPGYADVTVSRKIIEATLKLDSLDAELRTKDRYIANIRSIMSGNQEISSIEMNSFSDSGMSSDTLKKYQNIRLQRSREDSLLRIKIEAEEQYNLTRTGQLTTFSKNRSATNNISNFLFFTPLKGIITDTFDVANKHYGIDIVASQNEAVKATLDGTVIFAAWTSETGYVIGIQHQNNLLSIYKHNSVLLKKEGSYVRAGEAIAIIGDSGELTTGPHLHFELWYNNSPLNPKDYMVF